MSICYYICACRGASSIVPNMRDSSLLCQLVTAVYAIAHLSTESGH